VQHKLIAKATATLGKLTGKSTKFASDRSKGWGLRST